MFSRALEMAKSILTAALLFSSIENVIRQNQWGGADIRRGGDPVLRNNFICYGFSDGVDVGERGRVSLKATTFTV